MIKVLKTSCSVLGTTFFTCMVAASFLFNGDSISLGQAIFYIVIFALLTFGCMLAHWIITDHARNTDWIDFLRKDRRC